MERRTLHRQPPSDRASRGGATKMQAVVFLVFAFMVGVEGVSMYFMLGRPRDANGSRPASSPDGEFKSFHGIVRDWNGNPVPNIYVFLEPDTAAPSKTGADGTFEFARVEVPRIINKGVSFVLTEQFNLIVESGRLPDGSEYGEAKSASQGGEVVIRLSPRK